MARSRSWVCLFGCVAFLILAGAAPAVALKLDAPNGESYLASGSKYLIRWSGPGTADWFKLSYSRDNGRRWTPIASNVRGDSYSWKVPVVGQNEPNCLVKVESFLGTRRISTDKSDRKFAILAAMLAEPNGEETLTAGQVATIAWKTFVTKRRVASVRLSYSVDRGSTWVLIRRRIAGNPGTYSWRVPAALTGKYPSCKVRVELLDRLGKPLAVDTSDKFFSIGMVVIAPGTVVLDAESTRKIAAYDATVGELHFSGWTPLLRGLDPGRHVLVVRSAPPAVPEGLIGAVVGLRTENGQPVVTLGSASLTSVVKEGTVSFFHTFTRDEFEGSTARMELAEGVTLLPHGAMEMARPETAAEARAAGFGPESSFTYVIQKTFSGDEGNCSYNVGFTGSLTIGLDTDVSASLDLKGVKNFKFETRPFQRANLRVEGMGQCAEGKRWTIATLYGEPFYVQISYVPVVFVPYLQVSVGFDASATATVGLEATENLDVTTGVSFKRDREPKEWTSYWNPSYDFRLLDIDAHLNGALTGYVEPQAGVRIYGLAGPHFGVRGYLQLRGSVDLVLHEPNWGLYGGVGPFVGVDIDLLGLEKKKSWGPEGWEWEILLWPQQEPGKPNNLQASAGATTPIELSWDAADGAVMYDVYRALGKDQTSGFSQAPIASVAETRYTDNVGPDWDYTYYVMGRNKYGDGPRSNYASGWRMLEAPTLAASKGLFTDTIQLTWKEVFGAGKYIVYRTPGGQIPEDVLTEVPAVAGTTQYTYPDKSFKDGNTSYLYRVTAIGKGNRGESASSGQVQGSLLVDLCLNPEGTWAVDYGICIDSPTSGTWKFSQTTVELNNLGCYGSECSFNYTFVSSPSACSVQWNWVSPTNPQAGFSWTGTMNRDTGLTIVGKGIKYPRQPIMDECWTATRQAPAAVDKAYITVTRDSNGLTATWRRVPGAQKYNVEVLIGTEWKPLGSTPQTASGLIKFPPVEPYSGTLPPVLPGFRVQAENIAGKSAWTRYP